MAGRIRHVFSEGANVKALRGLMIGLAALVVLAVSGYGTVIYIQLMGKVFPSGPLLMACYIGAGANVLLMLVLLVGKFVWFRPGAHEVTSWIVTGVELLVCILNMMLAFELANGQALSSLMQAWYYLAPVSPVFSMVGAITLIMTSTELRKRHQELELQEQKDQKEREFDLAMHDAEMDVKHQYLGFIKSKLTSELNAPERHAEMADHAALLVSEVLSGLSGMQSVPRLRGPQLPNDKTIEQGQTPAGGSAPASLADTGRLTDAGDEWLARANERIEQERAQRFGYSASVKDENGQQESESVGVAAIRAHQSFDKQTAQERSAIEQRAMQLVAEGVLTEQHIKQVESWFGLKPEYNESTHQYASVSERIGRIVYAAVRRGYSAERIEGFLQQLIGTGGDAEGAKKK